MKNCVICGELLNDQNKSNEHIIHNAIGGSLEDDEIYCKKCNQLYGSNQDKAFTEIFAPIVDKLNMHKTRKTNGTSYTGIMTDEKGNLYTATYKSGKVIKLIDKNSELIKYEEEKFIPLYYNFILENSAFKLGLSKIAFNYAIHCGLNICCLDEVFDNSSKKLIDKPIVIPFLPITLFDMVMEMYIPQRLFHAVRIFNNNHFLYAYIELFNTFQHYVLLSEKYNYKKNGNIDNSYANFIEKNEPIEKDILEKVTPRDYKDADIISKQYSISINNLIKNLKKYHNYDYLDSSDKIKMLYKSIGKKAYEQIRTQPYITKYSELVDQHYYSINFIEHLQRFKDITHISQFVFDFRFYTIFDNDCVDIERYIKILPDYSGYPIAICENIKNHSKDLNRYGHMKFHLLEDHYN